MRNVVLKERNDNMKCIDISFKTNREESVRMECRSMSTTL